MDSSLRLASGRQEIRSKGCGRSLFADIEKRETISPDLAEIDFIIFSGDVGNAGRPSEYEDAIRQLFQPLLAASGVKPEKLFIIPGNHDLDRDSIPMGLSKALKSHDQVETWWNDEVKRMQLLQPFQAFYKFSKDYAGHDQPKLADILKMEIGGKKIALLGINSAWMCGRNKERGRFNDQGILCIGEPQIYEPLKQISDADIKIAVLHHPFDWLAPFDQSRVEVHLKRKCNIILHGHGHKPGISKIDDNFGYYVVIPAGACYDRRSTADSNYTFSYNFVHLDLESNQGTVFLRRWSDQNREWRKDDDTCPEGKSEFSIFRKEKVQIPHQIPTPPQDFTGRDGDLKELLDNFEQGATITGLRGMGGIGKTALAFKLAEKLADRYPDGQIFVDMKGTSDDPLPPAEAMGQVIHAFDPEMRTQVSESELTGRYRSKLHGKRVLLLLDNAVDDNQIRPLLPPASCGLIVTSRQKFTLPGLKEKDLNIMKSPEACALLLRLPRESGITPTNWSGFAAIYLSHYGQQAAYWLTRMI